MVKKKKSIFFHTFSTEVKKKVLTKFWNFGHTNASTIEEKFKRGDSVVSFYKKLDFFNQKWRISDLRVEMLFFLLPFRSNVIRKTR